VELLRPDGVELARRWLAALMIAPEAERPGLVEALERRLVETYGVPRGSAPVESLQELRVARPAEQREGYWEQTHTHYLVQQPVKTPTPKIERPSGSPAKLKAIRKPSA
jgi:hypothetical protein